MNNDLQPAKNLPKYCNVMEYLCISENILAKAKGQFQGINLVKWNNNKETEIFWSEVKECKDDCGEDPFMRFFNALSDL